MENIETVDVENILPVIDGGLESFDTLPWEQPFNADSTDLEIKQDETDIGGVNLDEGSTDKVTVH